MNDRLVLSGVARVLCAAVLSLLPACIWRGPPAYPGHTSASQSARCASIPFTLGCSGAERTVLGRSYCVHVPSGYVEGTRIPVALILGYLAAGRDEAVIRREFPDLTADDVMACLDYARELADFEAAPA